MRVTSFFSASVALACSGSGQRHGGLNAKGQQNQCRENALFEHSGLFNRALF
jgi:hypothetical protein